MALGRLLCRARRSRVALASLGAVLVALSLSGCRNKQEEARQKAELAKALSQYQAQIGELQKQASGLRARFDKLPEDLPGIDPVRDDLRALEEVLGVENGRMQWLSGKLDAAFVSAKKEDIEAVRKGIPEGDGGIAPLVVKVAHELSPLERLAAQRRFFESLDAARKAEAVQKAPAPKPR
jgi:hypothetical protein